MTKPQGHSTTTFICHDCDALQHVPSIAPGQEATCIRCGFRLFRNPKGGTDRPLALALSSLILFLVANIYPIMTINILGIEKSATITESALVFFNEGNHLLAAIVWASSVLIPGFIIFGLSYVLLSVQFRLGWGLVRPILVWLTRLLPWAMMDVFLLAIFVALVKLASLADILLGEAFYAILAFIFFYAATVSSIEPHMIWELIDEQTKSKNKGTS